MVLDLIYSHDGNYTSSIPNTNHRLEICNLGSFIISIIDLDCLLSFYCLQLYEDDVCICILDSSPLSVG